MKPGEKGQGEGHSCQLPGVILRREAGPPEGVKGHEGGRD